MSHKIRIGTEELDSDELNRRIPGLALNIPCSAKGAGGEDGASAPSPICHIFDKLSRWNHVLWHVGLQLRELRGPGRLSLVRVVYKGGGGCTQQGRSRDARILFHVLLVQHGCVESLQLDDVLMEGGGLDECRDLVLSALRQNTSLQTLTICNLYEHKIVCMELFGAIGTMTNLRQLIVGSTLSHSFVRDAICPLLVNTTCLTTLSMPGIMYNDETGTRLIDALLRNKTVETFSVNASILNTCLRNGNSVFCDFLANSARLTSLSVLGVLGSPDFTDPIIDSIVPPLIFNGRLRKLRLSNFRLTAECAVLLAVLVSRQQGCLESLDIGDCLWSPKGWPEQPLEGGSPDGEHEDRTCPWIDMFDSTAPVQFSFLTLGFEKLKLNELQGLLNTAAAIESLRTIALSCVPLDKLKAVCRVIRETEMYGRVHIEDVYHLDSSALSNLQEYPEALSKVAMKTYTEKSPQAFAEAVQLACSCYRVTVLELHMTEGFLSDVLTFRKLSEYLSTAASLKALWLTGCDEADLGRSLRSANRPYSVLLDLIFKNAAVRVLRVKDFRLGDANLRFLADEVSASKSLCELYFGSLDAAENDTFVRLLAAKFRDNMTISYLNVLDRTNCVDDEWFVIEDVISRNTGHLTCAAHYILGKDRSPRCAAAYAIVSGTNALTKRVDELKNQV